jgi:PAS domain S-box-containing protein
MPKILIVEDESIVALELNSRLSELGYTICGMVVSGPEAVTLAAKQQPDIILMDINIKGPYDGVETAEKIKAEYDIPIIFLTAFTDTNTLQRAKISEPYGYIVKPFEERELHTSIEIALYKHNMEKKLRYNERRLSTTLKSIGDAVIATDNNARIIYMNPAAEKLILFDQNSLGQNILDVFKIKDNEIRKTAGEAIKELIDKGNGDGFPRDLTICCKDGQEKIVESNISAVKDDKLNSCGIVLVFRDITEKFQAEAALLESEKKYRELVENASEIIFGLDLNWKFKYANAAALKISGYSKEELENVNFLNFILMAYRRLCKFKLMKQYLTKQKTTYIEYPFKSKSGKIIWFAQSNTIILEGGRVVGFDLIARDITEKKLAENKLNERNEFIETVLKNVHTGIIVSKIGNEEIILTNNKFEEIFGFTKGEIKNFSGLLEHVIGNMKYREEIKSKIYRGLLSRDPSRMKWDNIKITSHDNIKKFISCSIIPLFEQKILITSIEDITYKKHAEEEILKLSRTVEQSPVSVIITSLEGIIEYVNPKFENVTGYSLAEVKGRKPNFLSSGITKPEEYERLWNTIFSGNDWIGEFQNRKKNGELFWVSALISPIKDTEGNITYFLALEEDITERKKTEFELIRSKEKAEEMNRLKSVFLANMSHELRTPMVGILGFAQILKDTLKEKEDIDIAELLIKSGKRLLSTLESILEFSQLESKQVYLNPISINLSEKIKMLIPNFEENIREKKLKLNLSIEKQVKVLADDRLLSQVLNNIIDNAVKFTSRGHITIVLDHVMENDAAWGVATVIDTGIGISKEKQNIIFDDFRQASEGKTRSFEGNGLGLSVAKKIIEMMKGYITVDSDLGTGSRFSVYLPSVASENIELIKSPHPPEKKNSAQLSKKNLPEVLLVEDNEMNKEVVMIYLRNICNVDYANNGKSAVQMASQKPYSAILMDINLGNGFNGLDAIKKIKEINGYKHVPFVAITGYALYGDREKLLNQGCTHYLSKPFLKKDLVELVSGLINKK